jgi:exopolysaccharide production protein ExoQ
VALNVFERLFLLTFLLVSMQVLIGLTRPYEAEADPASITGTVHVDVLNVAVNSVVLVSGALLILQRSRRVFHAVRAAWPLVGLAAVAILSTAWSTQPTVTLRRSIVLLVSTLLAVYLGERYSIEEQVRLLTQTFGVMILVILVLRFAAPPYYVVDYVSHPGAWKGLSGYKNAFGQYMATAVLLLLLVRFRHFRRLRYVFLVLAVGLLLRSYSAASLFCCVLVAAVMPLWRSNRVIGRQRLPVYTIVVMVLVSGSYLLMTHPWLVLNLLGRNPTLTGRTQLWAAVWGAILKHPMLGYGYDAFWTGMSGDAQEVRIGAGWMAQRADNGFLDLGLSLGLFGVCLFFLVFALSFQKAIDYLRSERGPIGLWPITYLCFFLLHNMSESTLLTRGAFPDLVFIMITTSLMLNGRRRAEIANLPYEVSRENEFVPYAL